MDGALDCCRDALHIVDLVPPLRSPTDAGFLFDVGDDLVGRAVTVAGAGRIFSEEITEMLSRQIPMVLPFQLPDLPYLRRPTPV